MPHHSRIFYLDHFVKVIKCVLFLIFLILFVIPFTEGEKPETKQKRLEAKYAALQIVPNIEKLGTAKVSIIFFNLNSV